MDQLFDVVGLLRVHRTHLHPGHQLFTRAYYITLGVGTKKSTLLTPGDIARTYHTQ